MLNMYFPLTIRIKYANYIILLKEFPASIWNELIHETLIFKSWGNNLVHFLLLNYINPLGKTQRHINVSKECVFNQMTVFSVWLVCGEIVL